MKTDQFHRDMLKLHKVIHSCVTIAHWDVANNMTQNFRKSYSNTMVEDFRSAYYGTGEKRVRSIAFKDVCDVLESKELAVRAAHLTCPGNNEENV